MDNTEQGKFLVNEQGISYYECDDPFETVRDDDKRRIEINPEGFHETTLIFLHGLGDSCEGFYDYFAEWSKYKLTPPSCRIVLPTAPRKPVSCNRGYVMNSWFDIYPEGPKPAETLAEIRAEHNQDDLIESAKFLLELVEEERKKFKDGDIGRIYIGGFSQGCMVSLAAYMMH